MNFVFCIYLNYWFVFLYVFNIQANEMMNCNLCQMPAQCAASLAKSNNDMADKPVITDHCQFTGFPGIRAVENARIMNDNHVVFIK